MGFRFVRDKWHEGPAKLTVLILARLWFCLASTPPATRAVIHSAAPTAPAPARRTPGAGGTKYNSVLWPEGLLHCHEHCLRTAAPNPAPPPSTGSARASLQASFMPFARTPLAGEKLGAAGGPRPSPNALTVAPWTPPSPRASRPQPSSLPHPPPMLAPLHPQGVCAPPSGRRRRQPCRPKLSRLQATPSLRLQRKVATDIAAVNTQQR
jgi:hypothetical protein